MLISRAAVHGLPPSGYGGWNSRALTTIPWPIISLAPGVSATARLTSRPAASTVSVQRTGPKHSSRRALTLGGASAALTLTRRAADRSANSSRDMAIDESI